MKNMKKFAALALCAAMTASMMGAVTVSANDSGVESIDDLAGKKIGVQLGTTGDTYVTDEYEGDDAGTKIERFNKANDTVMALKQGKIDCIIIDSLPAEEFVKNNDDLEILEEDFATEEYAIAVKKGNDELTEAINGALKELKEEGILDQINENYIGSDDVKGTCPYESPEDADRSNGTLTMATNATFPPYEYYEGDKIVGIDVEMAQAVCDKLGYELKVEDMEFNAIMNAVASGKADIGVAGMLQKIVKRTQTLLILIQLQNRLLLFVNNGTDPAPVIGMTDNRDTEVPGTRYRQHRHGNPEFLMSS